MKSLGEYQDEFGFIGHIDHEGCLEFGDGAQRIGTYWAAQFLTAPTSKHEDAAWVAGQYRKLQNPDTGEWVRHPDKEEWWGQTGCMSRDNGTPLIVSMGFYKFYNALVLSLLWSMFWSLTKRLGFFWNVKHIGGEAKRYPIPDWSGPGVWIAFIRALDMWWAYPLLLVFDLKLLVSAIIRVVVSHLDPDNVGDDLNFQLLLAQASVKYPTPFSWVAKQLYCGFRANAGYGDNILEGYGPMTAFEWYYRHVGAPPMDMVWEPVIKEYL